MALRKISRFVILIVLSAFMISCSKAKFGIDGATLDSAGLGDGDPLDVDVEVICDPLTGGGDGTCIITGDPDDPDEGLLGEIYYLLPADHEDLFGGSLRNTVLQDYFDHGYRVETDIFMTDINVSPRAWTDGFRLPDGSIVKDLNGDELFEWFAIRLDGHLRLPEGEYDFAMISDDGMSVSLNGENILLHDGIHPPTWKCTDAPVSFGADESKDIHLEYFQGPRVEISMQLLMRPHDPKGKCKKGKGWVEIPAEFYTK